MAPSRRTVLTTGAAGLVTAAASANAQTTRAGEPAAADAAGSRRTPIRTAHIPIEMHNHDSSSRRHRPWHVANLEFPFSRRTCGSSAAA